MTKCVIHPIPIYRVEMSPWEVSDHYNFDHELGRISYTWYIEGPNEKILIDSGGNIEPVRKIPGRNVREIQTLDSGLVQFGLEVADIDTVILTHLHFDHVAQNPRYSKAKFIVQRNELEFAMNPHPYYAGLYRKEYFGGINLEIIEGDTSIYDGVSTLFTPGHSPGG